MLVTAQSVLAAVRSEPDQTALSLARRMGHETPSEIVPILNDLRAKCLVVRNVDPDTDVARWRAP